MMRALCGTFLVAMFFGCHVSFLGNDPINVFGENLGPGGEAQACSEPDDARRARSTEDGCASRCVISFTDPASPAIDGDCDAFNLGAPREGVATIDLNDADGMVLKVEVCDPTGAVFQVSDSETGDPDGGDAGSSHHDAQILLEGTTLHVRPSERSSVEPSVVSNWVTPQGCSERTLLIGDQLVYLIDTDAGLCGTSMLRINPPLDDEGTPDARWYLAFHGSVDGAASGSGLRRIEACFW